MTASNPARGLLEGPSARQQCPSGDCWMGQVPANNPLGDCQNRSGACQHSPRALPVSSQESIGSWGGLLKSSGGLATRPREIVQLFAVLATCPWSRTSGVALPICQAAHRCQSQMPTAQGLKVMDQIQGLRPWTKAFGKLMAYPTQ